MTLSIERRKEIERCLGDYRQRGAFPADPVMEMLIDAYTNLLMTEESHIKLWEEITLKTTRMTSLEQDVDDLRTVNHGFKAEEQRLIADIREMQAKIDDLRADKETYRTMFRILEEHL